MTLTLSHLPPDLDIALQQRAQALGKSIDEVAVEALRAGLAVSSSPGRGDFSEFAGSWIEDPDVEAALQDQDRIDPDLWR